MLLLLDLGEGAAPEAAVVAPNIARAAPVALMRRTGAGVRAVVALPIGVAPAEEQE